MGNQEITIDSETRKLVNICRRLINQEKVSCCSSETISAAFILDDMSLLPKGTSVLNAWLYLNKDWQDRTIKISQYGFHLKPEG